MLVAREQAAGLIVQIPGGHDPETTFYATVDAVAEALGLAYDCVAREPLEALMKGIAPHHSHLQHRGEGGQFLPAPDAALLRRLSPEEARAAAERAQALIHGEMEPRLLAHLSDFEAGHLTAKGWHARCAVEVRHFYPEAYLCGRRAAGDPASALGPQGKAQLNPVIADELKYLAAFADDLGAGKGVMDYHARLRLYANATWEAFWLGWAMGDLREGREIRWRWGGTVEHCADCAHCEGLGWLPVGEFVARVVRHGWMPRSGNLECLGVKCLCYLEERVLGHEIALWPYAEGEMPEDVRRAQEAIEAQAADAKRPALPGPGALTVPEGSVPWSKAGIEGSSLSPREALPASAPGTASPDARLAAALAAPIIALSLYAAAKREAILKDALAYLYLNERARAAYANDPGKAKLLAGVYDRAADWLGKRHDLPVHDAEDVLSHARSLHAYATQGRFVSWRLTRWPAPKIDDYPELKALYSRLGVA